MNQEIVQFLAMQGAAYSNTTPCIAYTIYTSMSTISPAGGCQIQYVEATADSVGVRNKQLDVQVSACIYMSSAPLTKPA